MNLHQKFHRGDLVRVAKNLGPSMQHFTADCDAIVIGSYADQYGGDDHKKYTLHLEGKGRSSWYDEDQLTLIAINRNDKLEEWKAKEEADEKRHGDLDWIFRNGAQLLKGATGATVEALARGFGLTNLWGGHGEGYVYYLNAQFTLKEAAPFLLAGDKAGWLAHCKTLQAA